MPPQGNKEALLAAGAVPLLLRCLQGAGAGGGAGVATSPPPFSALSGGPAKYAAHALCNLCLMEVRECGAGTVPRECWVCVEAAVYLWVLGRPLRRPGEISKRTEKRGDKRECKAHPTICLPQSGVCALRSPQEAGRQVLGMQGGMQVGTCVVHLTFPTVQTSRCAGTQHRVSR